MTDMIIKKLNQKLAEKITQNQPGLQESGQTSKFDQILTNKQNTSLMEKISESISGDSLNADKMKTLPADDIQINIQSGDLAAQSTTFDGKKVVTDMFSTLNSDMVKMDSMIEVLSSSDTQLSRRQLLAYQASIGTLSINTELFSRLAQSVSQNLNTLLQTNVG